MTPKLDFEKISFKPCTVNETLQSTQNLIKILIFLKFDTKYFTVNETKTFVSNIDSESFTALHLN